MGQVEIRIRIDAARKSAWLIEGLTSRKIQIDLDLARSLQEVTREGTRDTPICVHKGLLGYLFAEQEQDSQPKYLAIVNNLLFELA